MAAASNSNSDPNSSPATAAPAPVASVAASSAPAKIHLSYLDGLRGLAALYVAHFHLLHEFGWHQNSSYMPLMFRETMNLFFAGHFAVVVFIVLSGYCLMLPIARSGGNHLQTGFGTYIARRARRILPAYYAALPASALIVWATDALGGPVRQLWPNLTSWIAHLLLLHNLHKPWIHNLNGALWSIATEWQIYFIFPFLLLPLWRRLGIGWAVAISLALSIGFTLLFPTARRGGPWFCALFALGMGAALFNFRPSTFLRVRHWPFLPISLFLLFAGYALQRMRTLKIPALDSVLTHSALSHPSPVIDFVIGLATAAFLVSCTQALQKDRRLRAERWLSWKPLVAIGGFSYSFYLLHMPLVIALAWASQLYLPRSLAYVFCIFAGFPLIAAVSYAFYLAFERPFLAPQRSNPQNQAALSPLPPTPLPPAPLPPA